MGIVHGGFTYDNVTSAQEDYWEDAVQFAVDLKDRLRSDGKEIRSAVINRFDGLILFVTPQPESDAEGYHLQTPRCGYPAGDGTRATAEILNRLGFGEQYVLYSRLAKTNNDAFYR